MFLVVLNWNKELALVNCPRLRIVGRRLQPTAKITIIETIFETKDYGTRTMGMGNCRKSCRLPATGRPARLPRAEWAGGWQPCQTGTLTCVFAAVRARTGHAQARAQGTHFKATLYVSRRRTPSSYAEYSQVFVQRCVFAFVLTYMGV